jgi:putative spermidine/putrescine transport system ATP-binding protein
LTDGAGAGFLELSHVKKQFGTFAAVEDFSLSAQPGEFVSFLGPSGCGKTTTLRMIAGFEYPDSGSIEVDGKDISRLPPNKRNVGMVFQAYALFPNMSVASNIGFGMRVKKRSKDAIAKRVGELLQMINMPEKADRYPYQLSGGQQQRVALARALAIEPQVLLLDEPLSALDAKIRISLRAEIRTIQRQLGITTVYVTHDQEEALSLSDRVVVMSQGRIEQIGTPFEIYNYPTTPFVASFVGTLNALPARVVDATAGTVSVGGQTVRLGKPIQVSAGTMIEIALRPEILTLREAGAEANRLTGTVLRVTFLGSVVRVRITLDGDAGTVAFDTLNNPHLAVPAEGERVTLSFSPEAVLVLGGAAEVVAELEAEAEV